MMSQIIVNGTADAVLQDLRKFLGRKVYDAIMTRLGSDYFDGDIDIRNIIDHQPELFEAAFLDLLGQAGAIILSKSLTAAR